MFPFVLRFGFRVFLFLNTQYYSHPLARKVEKKQPIGFVKKKKVLLTYADGVVILVIE